MGRVGAMRWRCGTPPLGIPMQPPPPPMSGVCVCGACPTLVLRVRIGGMSGGGGGAAGVPDSPAPSPTRVGGCAAPLQGSAQACVRACLCCVA